MTRYCTIPFFIPHKGCPYQCVFCNQKSITGQPEISPKDVPQKVDEYLRTILTSSEDVHVEIGFFGGTFTGIPVILQKEYLSEIQPFIESGQVQGVRVSTRPDYIDKEKLELLKRYNVKCIELGVQSMSEKVLCLTKRGHTVEDVERASGMIKKAGFKLGHQIMVGLPASTWSDEYFTAKCVVNLGASQVRIYPVLVMKNTELASMWEEGKYEPLSEEEAIDRVANLILYFDCKGVKIIRCGLHPSEELLSGEGFLAGPFHVAFRQKAESRIFGFMLDYVSKNIEDKVMKISFNTSDEAPFFGFSRENHLKIEKIIGHDRKKLQRDKDVPVGSIKITEESKAWTVNRKTIYDMRCQEREQSIPCSDN